MSQQHPCFCSTHLPSPTLPGNDLWHLFTPCRRHPGPNVTEEFGCNAKGEKCPNKTRACQENKTWGLHRRTNCTASRSCRAASHQHLCDPGTRNTQALLQNASQYFSEKGDWIVLIFMLVLTFVIAFAQSGCFFPS